MPQTMPTEEPSHLNGTHLKPTAPLQLSFSLPMSPDTTIHLHITHQTHSLLIFLASSTTGAPPSIASCSSLVYALPNIRDPRAQPLSTALYNRASSVDFATRLAKIVARRVGVPVYVGGEVSVWGTEDEGDALRGCIEVVVGAVKGLGKE